MVFSNSFLLGVGVTDADPMKRFNQGQAITGHVAVDLFFIMSGYLVTLSLMRFVTGLFLTSNPGVYPDIIFAAIFSFLIVLSLALSVIGYLSWRLVERWFLPRERQE